MYQCQSAGEIAVGEVGEVAAQLQGREHPLIDDVLRGERDDVEILACRDVRLAYAVLDSLSYYIEFAVGGFALRKSGDEDLLDVRLAGKCGFSQNLGAGGHVAQVHQVQPLLFYLFDEDAQDGGLVFPVFGKEQQSGAVFPFFGNGDALQQDEFMRYLQHDAGAVSGLVVRAFSAAMAHVLQYLQRRFHQFVRLPSPDVDQHADSAGIVFVRRVVQARWLGMPWVLLYFCFVVKKFFFHLYKLSLLLYKLGLWFQNVRQI